MPAWLPILKAVLPHIATIVTSAIPAFTSRKSPESVPQQIAELQAAVQNNAEQLKVLARQLEHTVRAVEQGATSLDQVLTQIERKNSALEQRTAEVVEKLRQTRLIGIVSGVIAVIALCVAAVSLLA